MHLPATALPGGLALLQDPAAQAVMAQVFARRSTSYRQPDDFAPAFVAPTLLNSWVNLSAPPFNPAGYYRHQEIVYLRGVIASGVVGSAAFTLPAGFRPANNHIFAALSNGAIGRLDVTSAGDVIPTAGSNVYFSLDGISFRAA
jgi:hypothetical protein